MKQIQINTSKNKEPIPFALQSLSSSNIIIFINGDKDIKDSFYPIINKVKNLTTDYSLACFSFRGRETNSKYIHKQLILDLEEVLDYIIKQGFTKISLLATSSGFVSTAFILPQEKYSQYIKTVIFLDPADYPLIGKKITWSSKHKFKPKGTLVSSQLKNITSNVKIHTIFFALKTWDTKLNKIVRAENLNSSNPSHITRMNIKMTKNIYNTIPPINKGKWVEDKILPHAFERDYDVENNQNIIANYVVNLVK